MKLPPRVFSVYLLPLLLAVFFTVQCAAQQSVVINYGDVWKYRLPTSDPGTSWRTVGFNDSSWSSGAGFLGYETATLPAPGIKTVIGNNTANQPVYLFRKSFTFAGDPAGATFAIDHIIDDGVTYYLNGNLLGSVRHTPAAWNNLASSGSTEGVFETDAVSGPATGLVFGNNVLAAEVHQVSSPNSDMVFGSKLKITSTPLTLNAWRQLNFGTTSNTGNAADLADGDNDGLENIVEYALMQDPAKPSSLWNTTAVQGSNVVMDYTRRKSALNEMSFAVIWSAEMGGTWSSTGVSEQIISDDAVVQSVRVTVPLSGSSKRFFKIQVTRLNIVAPAVPTSLTATAVSDTQINLAWTDSSNNETGFKIERRQSGSTTWVQIATPAANVTTFSNPGLAGGTKYYYKVCATNLGGDSVFSTEANATTLPVPTAPAAPSGLSASVTSTSQINLSWTDNSNNETGFKIERRQSGSTTWTQIATPGANATSYSNTGLAPGTKYYFRVRASNAVGDSDFSGEVSGTTQGTAPTGPGLSAEYYNNENLSGTPTIIRTDATVNFNWGDNSPGGGVSSDHFSVRWVGQIQAQYSQTYTFYTSSDDGARLWVNGTQVINDWVYNGSTNSSGTIALTAGQKYNIVMEYYEVGGGASVQLSWSSSSTPKVTIPGGVLTLPTAPATPSGLSASTVSSSKINLAWTDNSNNETGFQIERKTGSGGTYALIATVPINTTSFQDIALNGLNPSMQYYYRVASSNTGGNSDSSNEANATTQPFENPGVYRQVVNNLLYEWIPTKDVNFQIQPDGKVKIIAPLTKRSINDVNSCNRFIYDHSHNRLTTADANALFGNGLALPVGNHGFAILWINATTYDQVLNGGWTLTNNPATYQSNSQKVDYFNISIVPVSPSTPAPSQVQEIVIPYDLQRVSWLPHYQILPYELNLPADKGFGVTRILRDIPLSEVYKKVTQIQYMYHFLGGVPYSRLWMCLRAYEWQSDSDLINGVILDKNFGYQSQMDEDFGNMGDSNHLQHAQQIFQGIYQRFQSEQGVTSPNQTRLYDDYFSDFGGYSNSENFRFNFNATKMVAGLSSQAMARKQAGGVLDCAYFTQGAYNYRNWRVGGYLDSFERIPEGIRVYNEIYNYEKRFMAAPDRKVAKMGWTNSEGVNSVMFAHGTESRLHFPGGDIIRSVEISWPFHMMLNESFWAILLGQDYSLWHSSVPQVSEIQYWGDSWAAGAGNSRWQPTGGEITDYNPNDPSHPARSSSPHGQFPTNPHLSESGAFTGAWLVSQLTTASDRISNTIEYCPFSYKINGGTTRSGYYNSNNPTNGSLGNAKLSRFGVANYGQSNIVKTFEAKKPICVYTAGANGAAVIYHNVYCGLTDVNEVTITTPAGQRTFQVTGNSLHVFYLN